jgi:hypothetical protein
MQVFKWTSVKKELPPIREDSNQDSEQVLVSLEDGFVSLDIYSIKYSLWITWGRRVTHWSPKPNPAERENE